MLKLLTGQLGTARAYSWQQKACHPSTAISTL